MSASSTDAATRLRLLYEVTSLRVGNLNERLDAALEMVTQALALDGGVVSHIEDDTYTVERVYAPGGRPYRGQTFPLQQTYCGLTLRSGRVMSVSDTLELQRVHLPDSFAPGIASYIGAAITVDGTLYGTLCFAGTSLREVPFSEGDEEMVEMLARWVGVMLEAQMAEVRRRASEARFRSAFHDAAIGMAMTALDGRFLEVNASVCRMLGYSREELLALGYQQVTHPEDLDANVRSVEQLRSGELETFQMEKRYLHKEGHVIWGHVLLSAVRDDEGRVMYFISQVQDITARKHYEEQVRVVAYRDELTGLHNRRYFFEQAPAQLALARRRGLPVALIYLDLNGFKEINDTLGHQTRDRLLQQAAARLKSALREEDLFARFGGDEFGVLLFDVTEAEARGAAARLAAYMKHPFTLSSGTSSRVGMSVGLVLTTHSSRDINELLKLADKAMYRAKGRKAHEPYAVEVVHFGAPSVPN